MDHSANQWRSARMPNPRRGVRRKYCCRTTKFLSTTLEAHSPSIGVTFTSSANSSHSPGFRWLQDLKPINMDKAILLPLRGSLGRKPRRATQAKVRARKKKKNAKNKKKEEKRRNWIEKMKKKKEEKKWKNWKEKKNIARKVENPEGRPWQKLERKRRG